MAPMSPLRGLGFPSYIAFFVFLRVACALKLDKFPSDVSLGESVTVSWTSVPSDPDQIGLFFSCSGASPRKIAAPLSRISSFYSFIISPQYIPSPLPRPCNLQARAKQVLDAIDVTVHASPITTTTSKPTGTLTSGPPSTSTDTFDGSTTPSASDDPTSSASSESTRTPPSPPTDSIDPSPSASSQPSPAETLTSQPAQSISSLSSTSDITATSSPAETSTSQSAQSTGSWSSTSDITATSSTSTSANSPTQATTRPTGAIIGAVVGGLLGLLILLVPLMFLCRRRYRKHLSRRLGLMRDVKPDLPSVPFSKDKEEALLAAEGGIPSEASNSSTAEYRHNRSGSSSLGHYYLDSHQGPDNSDIQPQSMRLSESLNTILVPGPQTAPNGEDREVQHIDHMPSTPKSSTREEAGLPHGAGCPENFSPRPMGHDEIDQSSSDALDTNKMDTETREQRRDALLERMRRVLDGEQSV